MKEMRVQFSLSIPFALAPEGLARLASLPSVLEYVVVIGEGPALGNYEISNALCLTPTEATWTGLTTLPQPCLVNYRYAVLQKKESEPTIKIFETKDRSFQLGKELGKHLSLFFPETDFLTNDVFGRIGFATTL